MPKKKIPRYANAASVRRRLVFDDEPVDNSVTFSAGKCISEPSIAANIDMSNREAIPAANPQETEEFRELLLTNPVISDAAANHDHRRNNYVQLKSRHYDDDSELDVESSTSLGYVVFLLCVLFVVCSFALDAPAAFNDIHIEKDSHNVPFLLFRQRRVMSLFGFVCSLGVAFVLGLFCCGFSWIIIYFDSLKPGRIPPTPLSPSKYRRSSGHTCHLSYAMSVICGVCVFVYYLWLSADSYLVL